MNDTVLINLIKENKRLICSIINKYTKYYEFDDLYQVSIIGIMKAYQNFQVKRNVKFTTYAYKYILSEVVAFVNQSKLIKTSREYNRLYKKILEARTMLTQRIMKEPSTKEIAFFLGIDESIINDVLRYQESVKSLDEVIYQDGKELTLIDRIVSEDYSTYSECYSLKEELANLSAEELALINMRYFEDWTQSEIATFWGTNQVQISRNEKKILKKLKKNLCQTQAS